MCKFCDTDFVGTNGTLGGKFETSLSLSNQINELWPNGKESKYVVLTGGEPLLQVDQSLIDALHMNNFEIAVETNGTMLVPESIDWICVSPKDGSAWIQKKGHELKLVFPQPGLLPENIDMQGFQNYLLQPMDGLLKKENTIKAINYCQANPEWRLSVQTHKILEIR